MNGDLSQQHRTVSVAKPENVILIHGFGGSTLVLRPLSRYLTRESFAVRRWCYWSVVYSVTDHARRLRQFLQPLAESNEPTHFVTHSMGSIILRAALAEMNWKTPGRWVMLAPPNHGSRVAEVLSHGIHYVCPALDQISTAPHSFVHRVPEPERWEVGVIASTKDILVGMESTHLRCEKQHITLDCGHTMMLFNREAQRRAAEFLREGRFSVEA